MLERDPPQPAVSIVVPIHDAAHYLEACLGSLLGQTLNDLQIICVDDASTDGSRAILEQAASDDPRLTAIHVDDRSGAGPARNHGLDRAEGEYVRFVDADDLLPPRSTERLLARARQSQADLVRGSVALFRETPDRPYVTAPALNVHAGSFRGSPELWTPWWHTGYLFSTGLIRRHGLRYPALSRNEDPEFLASALVHANHIAQIPDVVYWYRKYDKTTGSEGASFQDAEDSLRHASSVKALYHRHHAPAWDDGYGPRLLADFREFLARCDLDDGERTAIRSWAADVWGPEVRLFTGRPGGHTTSSPAANTPVTPDPTDRDFWNRFFERPDPWGYEGSPYEQAKYKHTLAMLPDGRPGRAVELGCAEGLFTRMLAPRVGRLMAVDISDVALERAQRSCEDLANIEFIQHDIGAGVPADDVELIVCSETLYYLRDAAAVEAFATSAWRALIPGGHLLMAHVNMVADDRTTTGFDFNEIGAVFIGSVFAAHPGFEFVRELRTELYRVQLFRRTDDGPTQGVVPGSGHGPREVLVRPHARTDSPFIKWGGCTVTAAEARHLWRTKDAPILLYHRIAWAGPEVLAPYRVAPARFERQLAWLQREGWHSVSLGDLADVDPDGARSHRGKAVAITFDDAYEDFYTHAWPLLRKYGFTATLFVPTDFVGGSADWDEAYGPPARLMTWEQLQELGEQGLEIGSHGCSHRSLAEMSLADASRECERSRQVLQERLGLEAAGYAYAYNQATPETRKVIADAGYRFAVSGRRAADATETDVYDLPRIEILGRGTMDEFIAMLPTPEKAPASEIARYHELQRRRDRRTYMDI